MSLLQTIKTDQITARKAKESDKISLLTLLYSEAANVGLNNGKRESTDLEVIATVKKIIKNIDETIKLCKAASPLMLLEKQWCEQYLPPQLNESQLTVLVEQFIENELSPPVSNRNMGQIMKFLNTEFAGQFDGKLASTVVKSTLSNCQ